MESASSLNTPAAPEKRARTGIWARRLGIGAFLFFLIKGLAWLALPALAVWWHASTGE